MVCPIMGEWGILGRNPRGGEVRSQRTTKGFISNSEDLKAQLLRVLEISRLLFLLALILDRYQFDLKNQMGVRSDVPARAALGVGKVRGNEKLPLRSHRHELQSFCPALDDAVDWECGRPAVLGRAVKLRAIDQRAAIITYHRVSRRRLRAITFFQNLVLQSAG